MVWQGRAGDRSPYADSTADLLVFLVGVGVAISGKMAAVTFKDANTLSITVPALAAGPQRIIITNPDGERVSLDAAITAN